MAPQRSTPVATLATIADAAAVLGVSRRHIQELINDAEAGIKGTPWRFGREIIDLSRAGSKLRTLRINLAAVAPGLERPL